MTRRQSARLFMAAALGCAAPARADDGCGADPTRHYVLLFGGKAVRWRPGTAHTWATFVRATPGPAGTRTVESFTISWLPRTLHVRPYALHPEPGRNLSLAETLDVMRTGSDELALWGPVETVGRWYGQAAAYKAVLDSGAVRFQTLDRADRRPGVNHCVHAVAFTDDRLHAEVDPILSYGERITRKLADAALRAGLIPDPAATHDWLLPALGLADDRPHLTRHRFGGR